MSEALCHAGADPFIERWFLDCVYTHKERIGFILGMASLLCWLVAQLPQFLANMRNQSAEALSPWFLAEWLLGDTSNLLGCLMTGEQLPTTTYTAMYFVVSDAVLMTQYIYYGALQKRRERMLKAKRRRRSRSQQQLLLEAEAGAEEHGSQAAPTTPPAPAGTVSTGGGGSTGGAVAGSGYLGKATAAVASALVLASLVCLALQPLGPAHPPAGALHLPPRQLHSTPPLQPAVAAAHAAAAAAASHAHAGGGGGGGKPPLATDAMDLAVYVGRGLGYLSSVFYLMARVSQIYKNWQRGTGKGLSPIMFGMAIAANLCQGSAILLRLQGPADLREQLPWLLGSLGVVAMDVLIISQVLFFHGRKEMLRRAASSQAALAAAQLNQPLLHTA